MWWCQIEPACPPNSMSILLGTCFTNGSLQFEFDCEFSLVWVHQTKMATYHGFITTNVVMHPCAKFHTIWTKIDQKSVHGCLFRVDGHDRWTTHSSLPLVLWYSPHFSKHAIYYPTYYPHIDQNSRFHNNSTSFSFFLKFKVFGQT
jgi:hypothetical protein